MVERFVDDGLTVIILANSDNGKADVLAAGVAERILPALGGQISPGRQLLREGVREFDISDNESGSCE
jgi:hypothetical protein